MCSTKANSAFTLVELLLVVTLIAILIGLTVPAAHFAFQSARKTEAAALISSLRAALVQYQTEYGDWPGAVADFTNSDGDIVLGFGAGADQWGELYRSLCGYSNGEDGYTAANGSINNSRRILFMEFQQKFLSSDTSIPLSGGESDPALVKNLIDPWNRPYRLILDANGDNTLSVPDIHSQESGTVSIPSTIAIWSTGPNPTNPTRIIATWK